MNLREALASLIASAGHVLRARPRMLAAITIVLFGVGATLIAYRSSQDSGASGFAAVPPPAELESRVMNLFSADECVPPNVASEQIGSILSELGHSDWTIVPGPGAVDATCVAPAIFAEPRQVTLLTALSPEVRYGLANLREELLQECRTKQEVTTLVESVLRDGGLDRWERRTGRISGPSDRMEEIEAHVADGCWIYSGMGWTAEGVLIIWIGGSE